jgi:ABC-2 type transport system permease protein
MSYLLPLGFYLMMGFVMVGINPGFLEGLIPAMVVFAILSATLLGLPEPLVKAREVGIFRSYKINGVPSGSILSIPASATTLHLVVVTVLIVLTAPFLFDAPLPVDWLNFVLTFLVAAFACAGISVLIGVISSSTRATVLWSQLFFIPSMLLGGLMIRNSMLPDVAGRIARVLPATHAMNAFEGLAMGMDPAFNPWASIIVLALGGVLGFGLAMYLFSWDSRNKTGRDHSLMAALVLLPFIASVFLPPA